MITYAAPASALTDFGANAFTVTSGPTSVAIAGRKRVQETTFCLPRRRPHRSGSEAFSRVNRRVSVSSPTFIEFGAGPRNSFPLSNRKNRFCVVPT